MNYEYLFIFIIIGLGWALGFLLYLLYGQNQQNQSQSLVINTLKEKLLQVKNENLLIQQKAIFVEKQSEKMIEQFKSLSHETVATQSFSFIKVIEDHIHKIKTSNQEENSKTKFTIKEILTPIENTIHNFEKVIHSFENKTSIDNREIFNKLSQVVHTGHNLQQEVNKVIHSLRSPNVKGIWGEMQLKRLVQLCGMEEHCDFQWQSTIEKGLKPDMVINLPNAKNIIVDSKVSLSAYINCMDTNDDEKKKYYMQEHSRQIKQHINILYNKKYWECLENSANFVILFLPGECFLSAALEVNPGMLEYATKYNIILATPTTMIGLLKTIAYGWENIHISRDIEKIKSILQNLYGELTAVMEDMGAMGKIIESLNTVYKNTYHTIDCNLKYTLEEIHNKYSITFHNSIKEDKLKKTKMPSSLKKEIKENSGSEAQPTEPLLTEPFSQANPGANIIINYPDTKGEDIPLPNGSEPKPSKSMENSPWDAENILRESHYREPLLRETLLRETLLRETLEKKPLLRETAEREPLKEPLLRETAEREPLLRETLEREPLEKEPLLRETAEKEPLLREPLKKEKMDPLHHDHSIGEKFQESSSQQHGLHIIENIHNHSSHNTHLPLWDEPVDPSKIIDISLTKDLSTLKKIIKNITIDNNYYFTSDNLYEVI